MVKKYKYEFYYRIDKEAAHQKDDMKEVKKDSYVQMDFERNLPMTDKEYGIASKKLIDSVANNINVDKRYITPIDKEEYMSRRRMS